MSQEPLVHLLDLRKDVWSVCFGRCYTADRVDEAGAAAGASGSTPLCADHNATQCHIWADAGECLANPLAVLPQCPSTCGVCSSACMDHDDRCRAWAHDSKCHSEQDEAFMVRMCPASCGICAMLDRTHNLP